MQVFLSNTATPFKVEIKVDCRGQSSRNILHIKASKPYCTVERELKIVLISAGIRF